MSEREREREREREKASAFHVEEHTYRTGVCWCRLKIYMYVDDLDVCV